MVFLDTNILLYSISTDRREAHKRTASEQLLERKDCVLSVQVLQEFFVQSTRPTRKDGLPDALAAELIRVWRRFPVVDNTVDVFDSALSIRKRFGFSLWDCNIVAAALAAGCKRLYSEDLSDGQKVDGLTIINPFA